MKKFLLLSSLASALALSNISQADEKVWVTIGKDGYDLLKQQMPGLMQEKKSFDLANDKVSLVKVHEKYLPLLSMYMHKQFKRCGGYMVHENEQAAYSSIQAFMDNRPQALIDYKIDQQGVINPLLPQIKESEIRSFIIELSDFNNRYYRSTTGVNAAKRIRDKWAELSAGRSDVSVELYGHSGWNQDSVVMTVQGNELADEIVVIGGHLDSINQYSSDRINARAPGADDNASGIATITEVIRVLMNNDYKPSRTLKFMGYAAEEVGLKGSQEIAKAHKNQGKNVVGVLQLDMTNYQGDAVDAAIITDYTSSAQNNFFKEVANYYAPELNIGTTQCGYACSDHASWHNQGFPATMPSEAPFGKHNQALHTTGDTISKSGDNANHAYKFAKMAASFAVEMAKTAGSDPDPDPGDYKQLKSVTGYCLSVNTSNQAELANCAMNNKQLWQHDDQGRLKHKSGNCLSVSDIANRGDRAVLRSCGSGKGQKWKMEGQRVINGASDSLLLTAWGRNAGVQVGVWSSLFGHPIQSWDWK
ncbi:M20/M25/M40 family metallo-hydrolase [Spartinivicinus ruber]|uniref:M20/M25/M40 family metallo-hydrolase n=1 Tax=Spartinivicinus ruber TaxID=2683272 RepID=UPI0013D3998A|nr:M20/M25/M40 family metallo-hydrolase [Spartinivicinus ruber]